MPLFFSLGRHLSLQAVQTQRLPGERIFAYLDDAYDGMFQQELWNHANIRVDGGKTRVWNCGSTARQLARSWNAYPARPKVGMFGEDLWFPESSKGSRFWSPLQATLISWTHTLRGPPSNRLLLVHCAADKATHLLRVLPPTMVRRFAWSCRCQLLGIPPNQIDMVRASATVSLTFGSTDRTKLRGFFTVFRAEGVVAPRFKQQQSACTLGATADVWEESLPVSRKTHTQRRKLSTD